MTERYSESEKHARAIANPHNACGYGAKCLFIINRQNERIAELEADPLPPLIDGPHSVVHQSGVDLAMLKPTALGAYLAALRVVHGERVYDQAQRLSIAPYQIHEFERGEAIKRDYSQNFLARIAEQYQLILLPEGFEPLLRHATADLKILEAHQ